MNRQGQGAKATATQRTEVIRLRDAGVPIRQIAAEVFGSECFRGRVERILRGLKRRAAVSLEQLEAVDLTDTTALLRQLFERRLAAWAVSGEVPSMSELRNLLEVQRRLRSLEELERVNNRTRSERDPRADRPHDDQVE